MNHSFLLPRLVIAASTFFAPLAFGASAPPAPVNKDGTKIYEKIGDKVPVIIALPDGVNTMRVWQKGNWIHFQRTATGYGEYGGKVSLRVVEGGADWSKGNIYYDMNYLEALETFDSDWQKIYNPVLEQSKKIEGSVDPKYVRMTLERLVTPTPETPSPLKKYFPKQLESVMPWWAETDDPQPPLSDDDVALSPAEMSKYMLGNYDTEMVAVYFRLKDHNLLRIGQLDKTRDYNTSHKFTFHKTSEGYGTKGGEARILGFGGGAEVPVGGQYDEIPALDAKALIGDDFDRLMRHVRQQAAVIDDSVDPQVLGNFFKSIGLEESKAKQASAPPATTSTPRNKAQQERHR